jgi:hypothetical protein
MKNIHAQLKKIFGYVFFIMLTLVSTGVLSQEYHYFDVDASQVDNSNINFHIFLTVNTDGSGSARVRYVNPFDGTQKLVAQEYKDTTSTLNASESISRYLTNIGTNLLLEGMEDSVSLQTRIIFTQQTENKEVFYEPNGVEFFSSPSDWKLATMKNHKKYTYDELRQEKDLLRVFYKPNDPIFEYLLIKNSRGGATFTSAELESKMYLIAVANTLDKKIGSSTQKDLDKINALFAKLAGNMGIPFTSYNISGSDFSINNVKRRIRKISPNSSDILIFYFSGHGFRYDEDTDKYARMSLRTNSEIQPLSKNNLQISYVADLLKNKGAHVTIVIGDCCNENIGSSIPAGVDVLRPRGSTSNEKLNVEVCKKLFFPSKPLTIVAGSAEKGQLSVGNPSLGGFFTNFLESNLTNSLYGMNGTSSWLKILKDAGDKTRRQALTALCGDKRCVQRAELSVVPPY